MLSISMEKELSLYNLEGKWNDYIWAQKEVLKVLRKEKFFEEKEVKNTITGMYIIINAKGIKETLGTGNRYKTLPKKLKRYKIATIRYLKEIIANAILIKDDVENIHEKNGYMFAYFYNEILIDEEVIRIRISVKKKIGSNWFWIHNIDENKKVPNYSTHLKDGIKRDSELLDNT